MVLNDMSEELSISFHVNWKAAYLHTISDY